MCLLVLKHDSAEYATNAFSSKEKDEKLAVVVHVLQPTQNLALGLYLLLNTKFHWLYSVVLSIAS